jgi:hypothetical protein
MKVKNFQERLLNKYRNNWEKLRNSARKRKDSNAASCLDEDVGQIAESSSELPAITVVAEEVPPPSEASSSAMFHSIVNHPSTDI